MTGGRDVPVKAYHIQHVQSGAEFRSADLAEVTQWMTERNLRYLSQVLDRTSADQEDAQ